MTVNVTLVNLPEFEAAFGALVARVTKSQDMAARAAAERVQEEIHARMNGPMPPKPAGSNPAYRSGMLYHSVRIKALPGGPGGGRWEYAVYSDDVDAPYNKRIEFGFHGTDSLGRRYNQPPYPFFHPGVEASRGEVREIFVSAATAAIEGGKGGSFLLGLAGAMGVGLGIGILGGL